MIEDEDENESRTFTKPASILCHRAKETLFT